MSMKKDDGVRVGREPRERSGFILCHTVSLVPRPFPLCARARNNWWVEKKRGKGSGESSRPSTGNGRNAGAVRMECILT